MVLINFTVWDMLACLTVGSAIMYKVIPTAEKLFSSSSLVSYWRWGVGKDGEIGSRAVENEDPFDLRVPMERVRAKARISERLYNILLGNLTLDNYDKYEAALRKKDDDADDMEKGGGDTEKEKEKEKEIGEEKKEDEKDEIVEVKVVQKNTNGKALEVEGGEATPLDFDEKKSPLRAKWRRNSMAHRTSAVGPVPNAHRGENVEDESNETV